MIWDRIGWESSIVMELRIVSLGLGRGIVSTFVWNERYSLMQV